MRGFDIDRNLPEEIVTAPGVGCDDIQLMTDAGMLPQHRRVSNGMAVFRNRVLVLMIPNLCSLWAIAPYLWGFLRAGANRQAESILTCASNIRVSIVNAVQGYSQVYRFPDTRRKRYGFMCSSA